MRSTSTGLLDEEQREASRGPGAAMSPRSPTGCRRNPAGMRCMQWFAPLLQRQHPDASTHSNQPTARMPNTPIGWKAPYFANCHRLKRLTRPSSYLFVSSSLNSPPGLSKFVPSYNGWRLRGESSPSGRHNLLSVLTHPGSSTTYCVRQPTTRSQNWESEPICPTGPSRDARH